MKADILAPDCNDRTFKLDLFELETTDLIKRVGGTIIIKRLHDYVPPIACTHLECYELADYVLIAIESDEVCNSFLCEDCLDDMYSLGNVPLIIVH